MSLEIVKGMSELSQKQFESILNAARFQRLQLRIKFKEAYNLKLSIQSRRTKDLLEKQLSILCKDIQTLDKQLEKCNQRMEKINIIRNQVTYIQDAIEEE